MVERISRKGLRLSPFSATLLNSSLVRRLTRIGKADPRTWWAFSSTAFDGMRQATPHDPSALYRKWRSRTRRSGRPKTHIMQTLRNAARGSRGARLFSFPARAGKTSTAHPGESAQLHRPRRSAPLQPVPTCIAINEGAHARPDRDRRRPATAVSRTSANCATRSVSGPAKAAYKIYIATVHMLSNPAFNALLKTLERPPPHAPSSWRPQGAPDAATVLSRCQRFDFRRIPPEIAARLRHIVDAEQYAATTRR